MRKKLCYKKLTPFLKLYFAIVIIISSNSKSKSKKKFSDYLNLDYEKIFNKNQYWRFFTNIFILGKL